ncbi:MAG TPA: protein kinase [Gemmataceae bacterium]|jgi:serine/threonine protein kinase
MPAPCTADDLLALVRKSGVADRSALEDFERRAAAAPPTSPRELADHMIRDGVLTNLQADQLLRGRWRNFAICGKYKLLEHLGSGGMGRVYLCEHTRMGRRVAIKVLPADKATDSICLERFFREARASAALDHPNIVRAHDIDRDDSGRAPLHFLVMEYVDGSSLQDIVSRCGPLSVERACHYVRQAACGLQHAHGAGLVHRDIKPANLLLDRSGLVKILDLGLARFFHDASDDLTRKLDVRALIGTADYLAPEQAANSHAADIRADIYSLGVTFYFLLTGRSPFKDGTVAQKLLYHRLHRPEPVTAVRPDVPAGVARVIDRMLAKDPADRYQTPAEVAAALDPWTVTPIPPPPESEMPRLSRAAQRAEPPTSPIQRGARSTIHNLPAPSSARIAPAVGPHRVVAAVRRVGRMIAATRRWFRRRPST